MILKAQLQQTPPQDTYTTKKIEEKRVHNHKNNMLGETTKCIVEQVGII